MTGPARPWWWQGGGGHVPQCCFLLFLPHCPRTPTCTVGQCHLGLGWHRAAGMAKAGCSDGVSTEVWGLPPVPRAGLPRGFGVRPCPRPGGSVSRGPQLEPQPLGPPWRLEKAGEHSLGSGQRCPGSSPEKGMRPWPERGAPLPPLLGGCSPRGRAPATPSECILEAHPPRCPIAGAAQAQPSGAASLPRRDWRPIRGSRGCQPTGLTPAPSTLGPAPSTPGPAPGAV